MLKILIIDADVVGLGFAVKCVRAGHRVRYFLKPGANPDIGVGFEGVEKIDNWVASVTWADLVFPTTNSDYMARLQFFKDKGYPVFGPSIASADLEIKRGEGMKFLEKQGIEVPRYEVFKTLNEAEKYVLATKGRYVFKPLGSTEDKSLTYCSKGPDDMIARLRRWQKLGLKTHGDVMLQEFVDGIEFAVSRWMGKNGFIGKYNENFEHKKMLSGNYGPSTGEMGTVQRYCDGSVLGEEMLKPLEESLVEMGHLGDIDVNCIVDRQGQAWPLEFTARPGYPAFLIMLSEHIGDPAQWMVDALQGQDTMEVTLDVATGLVVAIPDFPHSKFTKKETTDIPFYGITKKNQKYIHVQAMKRTKMPVLKDGKIIEDMMYASAGDYLAVVTGTGKTVKKACERAYQTLHEYHISDMIVRDDIGESLKDTIPKLQQLGYAAEWTYQ